MPSGYALGLRWKNSRWEVLIAQKHVIDFKYTLGSQGTMYICNNPGEYVIPGGGQEKPENLETTALREFAEETVQTRSKDAKAELFYTVRDGQSKVLAEFYYLFAVDNKWMTLADDTRLAETNNYLGALRQVIQVDPNTGQLRITPGYPVTPNNYTELHQLMWEPLSTVVQTHFRAAANWASPWQQTEYAFARSVRPNYWAALPKGRWDEVNAGRRIFPDWFKDALAKLQTDLAHVSGS